MFLTSKHHRLGNVWQSPNRAKNPPTYRSDRQGLFTRTIIKSQVSAPDGVASFQIRLNGLKRTTLRIQLDGLERTGLNNSSVSEVHQPDVEGGGAQLCGTSVTSTTARPLTRARSPSKVTSRIEFRSTKMKGVSNLDFRSCRWAAEMAAGSKSSGVLDLAASSFRDRVSIQKTSIRPALGFAAGNSALEVSRHWTARAGAGGSEAAATEVEVDA
mmetsp:Transcript_34048/g.50411  ORF Transcript_34048/g.50411 Transcript_34048/m.50411 type:complete len:214 (+) Transcript_34048:55-696(+)